MHNSTKKLDEKEIKGFIVRLWCKASTNPEGTGESGGNIWVSAGKDGKTFRSNTMYIPNQTDQPDQLRGIDRVEDLEIISKMAVRIRLKGGNSDFWVSAVL